MSHEFTTAELAAITYWPFPPPEDYIFDHEQLKHWVHDVLMVTRASDRSSSRDGAENREVQNSRFVALATSAMISGVLTEQQFAGRLGDDVVAKMSTDNASRVAEFVDGLIASPPIVELVPLPPFGTILVIPLPVPIPEPVPPDWGPDEELTGRDLLSVGVRLHAAAGSLGQRSLQEEFLTAAERLIEVGHSRLTTGRV